ncbi:MAG: hypothetical protein OHK0046_50250 [Anaerolineae bacterium]
MLVVLLAPHLVDLHLLVDVAVGRFPGPATIEQLGQHPAAHTLRGDRRLTLCHAEQDVEIEPVIRITGVKFWVRGKAHADA